MNAMQNSRHTMRRRTTPIRNNSGPLRSPWDAAWSMVSATLGRFASALIFVLICLTGCHSQRSDDPRGSDRGTLASQDSHNRMLDTLAKIKADIPTQNFFLGDADLIDLQTQLDAQPEHAYAMRGALLFEIGSKNVFLGQTSQGIQQQKAAFDLLRQAEVPQGVFDKLFFSIGVSHLRKAENDNCIDAHTAESCIFPIRDDGVHLHQEETLWAIAYFNRVLETRPDHLPSRWLLNLSYMAIGRYPDDVPESFLIPPDAFESEQTFPRFVDRAGTGAEHLQSGRRSDRGRF